MAEPTPMADSAPTMPTVRIDDGLRSLLGKMGEPGRDKSAGLYHDRALISDEQLLEAYRSDWISRKLVDIPADDALRKWRSWPAKYRNAIIAEETRLKAQRKALEAMKKGRHLGGAVIYIGIDGQDPAEPLDPATVGRGQLSYLTVLSRLELTAGELERDPFSPQYGKPAMYETATSTVPAKIHPTRLAIFGGDDHADPWRVVGATAGWSESVLVGVDTAIKQAISSSGNISSLLFEANVDVVAIPNLAEKVGTPENEAAMLKRFSVAAAGKGITGMLILDSEEEYSRRAASFANLSQLMEGFYRMCAAAADIPVTRFLAQSPSGLVATGEHDMSNYYNKIEAEQKLEVDPAMSILTPCIIRSALGEHPDDCTPEWRPLAQMSEKEIAEVGKLTCESLKMISELGEGGAFLPAEMRMLATHRLSEISAFPHLTEITAKTANALEVEPDVDLGPDKDDEGS